MLPGCQRPCLGSMSQKDGKRDVSRMVEAQRKEGTCPGHPGPKGRTWAFVLMIGHHS